MGIERLERSRREALPPQDSVSTNSTISPLQFHYMFTARPRQVTQSRPQGKGPGIGSARPTFIQAITPSYQHPRGCRHRGPSLMWELYRGYGICPYGWIYRSQDQTMLKGLADEKAIERVSME